MPVYDESLHFKRLLFLLFLGFEQMVWRGVSHRTQCACILSRRSGYNAISRSDIMIELIDNIIKLISNLLVDIVEVFIPLVLLIAVGWALVIIFEPIIRHIKKHLQ